MDSVSRRCIRHTHTHTHTYRNATILNKPKKGSFLQAQNGDKLHFFPQQTQSWKFDLAPELWFWVHYGDALILLFTQCWKHLQLTKCKRFRALRMTRAGWPKMMIFFIYRSAPGAFSTFYNAIFVGWFTNHHKYYDIFKILELNVFYKI